MDLCSGTKRPRRSVRGSCEVRVLAGKVDHRDMVLTRAEQDPVTGQAKAAAVQCCLAGPDGQENRIKGRCTRPRKNFRSGSPARVLRMIASVLRVWQSHRRGLAWLVTDQLPDQSAARFIG